MANNKKQPVKRAYKKRAQPAKRAYVKRAHSDHEPVIKIIPQAINMMDELDLLRDVLAAFESMSEEARFRAYSYFTSKYSKYGTTF